MDEKNLQGRGRFFYPSVNCGPVNNAKSKALLEFQPTKLETAIQETVDFFKSANVFVGQKKKVDKKVKKATEVK